jgi:PIN domain nuclease of toxin-antitoxin system
MNLILDTHTFIWFLEDDENLSTNAAKIIQNPTNQSFVSMASLWEMAIKIHLKKLNMTTNFDKILDLLDKNGIELLPINFEHTKKLIELDDFHRDPFDRMIIAQAIVENMQVIGRDEVFDNYGINRLW